MTLNRKVTAPVGLPGCGKSTGSKEVVDSSDTALRINFDLLRECFWFSQWSKKREKTLHKIAKAIAKAAFDDGYDNVILDNVNLSNNQKSLNRSIAEENKAEYKEIDMTWVPVEECIERDRNRPKSVGEKTIRDFWNRYLRPPAGAAGHDLTLSGAIIVDLDGTLFEHGDERSPYDWDKVYGDSVRSHVLTAIKGFRNQDYDILFVSGREDIGKCREESARCIFDKAGIVPQFLFMRKAGDHRPDYIVKKEIYEEHIKGKWDIDAIFDDRAAVIDHCWSALGFDDRIFRVGRIHADNF